MGGSPHEILALASTFALARPLCPGIGRGGRCEPVEAGVASATGERSCAGIVIRKGSLPAGAAALGDSALWAMTAFAAAVLSAPQAGHSTGDGIRPLIGSTSKANRCPHSH